MERGHIPRYWLGLQEETGNLTRQEGPGFMDPVLEWRQGKERAGLSNTCGKVVGQSAENLGFLVRFPIFTGRQEVENCKLLFSPSCSLFVRYLYDARQFFLIFIIFFNFFLFFVLK